MILIKSKPFYLVIGILFIWGRGGLAATDWMPPNYLVGKWVGKAHILSSFDKSDNSNNQTEQIINIQLTIQQDGQVSGKIGDAQLIGCRVSKNRGWLGKKLNYWTDYIVNKGRLDGYVTARDKFNNREISIPFNIIDGRLNGCFWVLKKFSYPHSLFPKFSLGRIKSAP